MSNPETLPDPVIDVAVIAFPNGETHWTEERSTEAIQAAMSAWSRRNPGAMEAGTSAGVVTISMRRSAYAPISARYLLSEQTQEWNFPA